MTRRRAFIAAGALAALALAFVGGRLSKPAPPAVTRTVTVEKLVDRVVQAEAQVHTVIQAGPVRTITKIVRLPSGEVREERTEETAGTTTRTEAATKTAEITRTVEKTRDILVVKPAPPAPRFTIAAGAGYDFTRSERLYGVQASYRVAGPLVVGAVVTAPGLSRPAGLVTLGVTW